MTGFGGGPLGAGVVALGTTISLGLGRFSGGGGFGVEAAGDDSAIPLAVGFAAGLECGVGVTADATSTRSEPAQGRRSRADGFMGRSFLSGIGLESRLRGNPARIKAKKSASRGNG